MQQLGLEFVQNPGPCLVNSATEAKSFHLTGVQLDGKGGVVRKRIIIGITGASGVIYGIRLLEHMRKQPVETHLVISKAGIKNIEIETEFRLDQVIRMADYVYENHDIGAAPASGSFVTDGMIVIPCTIKTLSGIANSFADNLIIRAADVTLKEKRKLVLVVRETPLHKGHLKLMTVAAELGAHILPPVPSFYSRPKTIEDILDQTIGKILDYMGIQHQLYKRWGSGLPLMS